MLRPRVVFCIWPRRRGILMLASDLSSSRDDALSCYAACSDIPREMIQTCVMQASKYTVLSLWCLDVDTSLKVAIPACANFHAQCAFRMRTGHKRMCGLLSRDLSKRSSRSSAAARARRRAGSLISVSDDAMKGKENRLFPHSGKCASTPPRRIDVNR